VAAIAAGVVVWLTGWTPIDPLLSILIGGLEGLRHEAEEHGIGHATFQPETVPWTPLVRHD